MMNSSNMPEMDDSDLKRQSEWVRLAPDHRVRAEASDGTDQRACMLKGFPLERDQIARERRRRMNEFYSGHFSEFLGSPEAKEAPN